MVITKTLIIQTNINLRDVQIERLQKYKYLGSLITKNNDQTTQIRDYKQQEVSL